MPSTFSQWFTTYGALYGNIAFSELWSYLNQSEVDQQTLNAWQNATIIAPDARSDLAAIR